MPDAPTPDAGSLSARAHEILRRADAQLEALKAPAPPRREVAEEPEEAPEAPQHDPSRPAELQDLGQLVDTVQTGIEAAATHLVALSESLERIAEEIDAVNTRHPAPLPPGLASHARMPDVALSHPAPAEPEPAAAEPAAPEPEEERGAAHDAARLVAIEMAVAGDTREGVGRRLREEFGIRDPRSILDDAFGPEPPPSGRSNYGT